MTDIIIIGAGPAGIYAGFLAKSQHLSSLIIEASNEIGGKMTQYADKPIYDMPGHKGILSKDLLNDMYEQYNSHDHEGDIHQWSTDITRRSGCTNLNSESVRVLIHFNSVAVFEPA